jgi:HTH-type transcriptional regulator / antitoxin HigA
MEANAMNPLATTTASTATRRKTSTRVRTSTVWPIHSEEDYDRAVEVVNRLAICPEGSLSPGDQARLDIFVGLIGAYDAKHYTPYLKEATGLELLRFLVAEHGMSESDLGRLLGNRQTGHEILSGKRELSKANLRVLSKHFGLPVDAFFD